MANRNPTMAALAHLSPVVYGGVWIAFVALFALGGMALPGPRLPVGALVGNPHYAVSIWAVAGWVLIVLPLLAAAGRYVWPPRSWRRWLLDPARRPILALGLWGVVHNGGYMAVMPVPGTASRYGALNYILLWLALLAGLLHLSRRLDRSRWLLVGLAALALANTVYWRTVYHANLAHMQAVRMAAAEYVRRELPPGALCGVYDIGAIRYFSRRTLVDLGGLIDPDAPRHFLSGSYDRYLLAQRATCLILPGRMNTLDEGWFDMARALGLATSTLFDLEPITVFEIEPDRWLQGYLATNNYQASVVIYRLALPETTE